MTPTPDFTLTDPALHDRCEWCEALTDDAATNEAGDVLCPTCLAEGIVCPPIAQGTGAAYDWDDRDDEDADEPCPSCSGSGFSPDGQTEAGCPACYGRGILL